MKISYQYKDVFSIIVTYNQSIDNLKNVIQIHKNNFRNIILVNNSPEIPLSIFKSSQIIIIENSNNLGLACALNKGILVAKKQGAKLVALFDQDTVLPDNFTHNILKKINKYQGDIPPALFSPVFYNNVTDDYGWLINFKPFRLIRRKPNVDDDITFPQYVITSGSLIPMSVIDNIGLMREELFIDFIDIEWCIRARAMGYEIISFPSIIITHHLGDYSINILGKNYPIHSPLRMYYYFRNAMFLYRSQEIDWNWRFVDATRNFFRFLFYMLFIKNRRTYFKYIIKGYYNGFIKKMGKLDE